MDVKLFHEELLPNFGLMVAVKELLSKQCNAATVEQMLSPTRVETVVWNAYYVFSNVDA